MSFLQCLGPPRIEHGRSIVLRRSTVAWTVSRPALTLLSVFRRSAVMEAAARAGRRTVTAGRDAAKRNAVEIRLPVDRRCALVVTTVLSLLVLLVLLVRLVVVVRVSPIRPTVVDGRQDPLREMSLHLALVDLTHPPILLLIPDVGKVVVVAPAMVGVVVVQPAAAPAETCLGVGGQRHRLVKGSGREKARGTVRRVTSADVRHRTPPTSTPAPLAHSGGRPGDRAASSSTRRGAPPPVCRGRRRGRGGGAALLRSANCGAALRPSGCCGGGGLPLDRLAQGEVAEPRVIDHIYVRAVVALVPAP